MQISKKSLIAFVVFDLIAITIFLLFFLRPESATIAGAETHFPGVTIYPEAIALSDFQLLDQQANEFHLADFRGAWTLVFFGFTSCPDVCPLTLAELQKFYRTLQGTEYADDTRVILVSVDPARDSPAVMADYLQQFNEEFIGLTGAAETIAQLAKELYISHSEISQQHEGHVAEPEVIAHSAHIAVMNPEGKYHSVIWAPHEDSKLTAAYQFIRSE